MPQTNNELLGASNVPDKQHSANVCISFNKIDFTTFFFLNQKSSDRLFWCILQSGARGKVNSVSELSMLRAAGEGRVLAGFRALAPLSRFCEIIWATHFLADLDLAELLGFLVLQSQLHSFLSG